MEEIITDEKKIEEVKEAYRKGFFIKKIEHIIDIIKCVDQSKIDPFIKKSINIDESLKCLNDLSSYNFDKLIDKYIFANNLLQTLENSVIVNRVTTTGTINMSLDEAIEHCKEMSEKCANGKCALEHKQLYDWLNELKVYRMFNPYNEDQKSE